MRKSGIVLAVAAMILAVPIFAGLASAEREKTDIIAAVEQGTTDRLGGGDWVVVHAGNTDFGVIYGTPANPNKIYIFADEKRYLAGVDFYDAGGNLIRTRGIPVWTVYAQSLERMIEFKDTDGNNRFDLRMWEGGMDGLDVPIKGLNLVRGWALSDLTQETSGGILFVNFTVGISDVMYTWTWSRMFPHLRQGTAADGEVSHIAFTFHIRVAIEDATARIPWFRVTIAGSDERRVLDKTFEGWREYSGQAVNMSVKYDHLIEGWDFVSDESDLLLETRILVGHVVPRELQERYRQREGGRAYEGEVEREGAEICDDRNEVSGEPREIPAEERHGSISFADDWYKIGRFTWSSDVTVDGTEQEMYFQIHGGGPMSFEYGRAAFAGFGLLGAFVYPSGQSILHDPGFSAVSYEISLPTITNLASLGVLFLQVLLVVLAVVLAVIVRLVRKGRKDRPVQ